MRLFLRLALAATVLLGPAAGRAFATSLRDLVELHRAGLGDEVLIALIESDGSVFRLGPSDLLSLRKEGLSDALLVAMIRTGAKPVPVAAPEPQPAPVVADPAPQLAPQPIIVQSPPVYVSQQQRVTFAPRVETVRYVEVPVAVPVYVRVNDRGQVVPPEKAKAPEPVYWGFGGKRRPDTWKDQDQKH